MSEKIRRMIYISLLIAMNIVFVRLLSFQTPITRLDFGFLPISLAGAIFGPFWGGLAGGVADVVGMLVNNKGMAYFFPWTINAILNGVLYGVFLYRKPKTWLRVILCVLVQGIFVNLCLGSVWSYLFYQIMLQKQAIFPVIFWQRLLTVLITAPIHIVVIRLLCQGLKTQVKEL